MDAECVALCEAMNLVPGIRTTESCCGHNEHEYRVFFNTESLEALPPLLYWFDGCHSGCYGWKVIVRTDCGCSPAYFYVEGPTGQRSYDDAKIIAERIVKDNTK